jgi:hypothetical protein
MGANRFKENYTRELPPPEEACVGRLTSKCEIKPKNIYMYL